MIITGLTVVAAVAGAVVRSYASTEASQILFSWAIELAMEVLALLTTLVRGKMADRAGTEQEWMPREIQQSKTVYSLAILSATVEIHIRSLRMEQSMVATAEEVEMVQECGAPGG